MATIVKIAEGMTADRVSEVIDNNFSEVLADINAVQQRVAAEETRAKAAEAEMQTRVENANNGVEAMKTRLTTAEEAIAGEITRALREEKVLREGLAEANETLESVQEDVMSVSNDVSNLEGALATEKSEREAEVTQLSGEITDLSNQTDEAIRGVRDDMATEVETLRGSIATEKSDREAAVEQLAGELEEAKGELGTAVATEKSEREAAVDTVSQELASATAAMGSAITAEKSERVAAVEGIVAVNNAQTEVLKRMEQAMEPLVVTLTGGGGVYEEGTEQAVTLKWSVKKGGQAIDMRNVTTLVNDEPQAIGASMLQETVTSSKTWKVSCLYDYEIVPGATNNVSGSATTKVTFVKPIYTGGSEYDTMLEIDVETLTKHIKTSVAGTYTLKLTTNGWLWLIVPESMTVKKVTMEGLDVPMTVQNTGGPAEYNCWRTDEQIVPGEYQLKVEI